MTAATTPNPVESKIAAVAGVTLVLVPTKDPLARTGATARDPSYRLRLALKTLLRGYGLRCVGCRLYRAGDPSVGSPAE